MRKRTVLKTFKFMAAGVTVAMGVTPAYSLPTNGSISAPADTTRVIDIEEVVVIATPKENNRLRQQPLSATSFSHGDMRNNSVTSVKSLSGLVPNLFIPDYGSKLTTSVYVRGIGSRINTPAVGLYVDNIPFIDKSAFDFNYSDIERIDVLRGPQGTLYGRNTMGGLIRVFTKSPFTYQGTDISLGAATYNNYKASVNHYHRISEKFAFSAGAFYEHEGGFFENTARNNEKIDKGDEVGGRMRAIWLPKENLKLDFTVNYEYSNQGGYPYQLTSLSETDVYYQDLKGDLGKVAYNNECGYMRHLLNGGLNIEHQAENFILSSVTGFQYLKDFMGYNTIFLLSEDEVPRGKVLATPVENIVLYYVDPADSDFVKAGLVYTTGASETNLIGFHTQGNYNTAVSEAFAIMGLTLFAEYIDGIAVITVDSESAASLGE